MELQITMIRHGITKSGETGILYGEEDESLSAAGVQDIVKRAGELVYPKVSRLYTSPTRSCLETTTLIYKGFPALIVGDMLPFDYGVFGGRSGAEITSDPRFREWGAGDIAESFPGSGSPHLTAAKIFREFREIIEEMEANSIRSCSIITHREAIMLILNRFSVPLHRYFEGEVSYGGGYTFLYDSRLSVLQVINSF